LFTPGWFPDPHRRFDYRYHNGDRWTADVSLDGVRSVDPHGVQPNSTLRPAPGAWAPAPPTPRWHHPARRRAVAACWLGLGAVVTAWVPFLFVVGAGAAVAALVTGIGSLRRARLPVPEPGSVAGPPGSPTAVPLGPPPGSVQVQDTGHRLAVIGISAAAVALGLSVVGVVLTRTTIREFDAYTDPGRYDLTPGHCALDGPRAVFDGTITNQEAAAHGYVLRLEYRDGTRLVATAAIVVPTVAAGNTVSWHDEIRVGNVALACEVTDVNGPYPFGVPVDG
jgi:hypothetical protein